MVRMARAHTLGDLAMQRAVTSGSLILSLGFGVGICIALVIGAGPLAHGFFDNSAAGLAAAGLAAGLLMLLGVMELIVGPGSAAAGLLRGRKVTRAPMLYVLIGHWAVGAPLGIYLCEVQSMGIAGVWIGLSAGTLLTTALTLWRLFAGRAHATAANTSTNTPLNARTGTNGPFRGDSSSVPKAVANRS
jgi:MATE family multidrug resistance protein